MRPSNYPTRTALILGTLLAAGACSEDGTEDGTEDETSQGSQQEALEAYPVPTERIHPPARSLDLYLEHLDLPPPLHTEPTPVSDLAAETRQALKLSPLQECAKGPSTNFYAQDANHDGLRDSVDPQEVSCSDKGGLQLLSARKAFEAKALAATTPKEDFNLAKTDIHVAKRGTEPTLIDFLSSKRQLGKTKAVRDLAKTYLRSQMRTNTGRRHEQPLYDGHTVEIINGTITVSAGQDNGEVKQYEILPWSVTLPEGAPEEAYSLVDIPSPAASTGIEWNWQRPATDPHTEQDLDFHFQSGEKAPVDSNLRKLARILPSSWNIAKIPDDESGIAMMVMFDGCCDFSPVKWREAGLESGNLSSNATVVSATRGGFVVMSRQGVYAFEPGKGGHQRWNSQTEAPVSGDAAVAAELSGYAKKYVPPKMSKTSRTIVRRGNPHGENYWNEDWTKKTLPASLAAIHALVGNKPFWIGGDDYWGHFHSFEGSGKLKLIKAKIADQGIPYYQVRFL